MNCKIVKKYDSGDKTFYLQHWPGPRPDRLKEMLARSPNMSSPVLGNSREFRCALLVTNTE